MARRPAEADRFPKKQGEEERESTKLNKPRKHTKMTRLSQAEIDYCIAVHKATNTPTTMAMLLRGPPKFTEVLCPTRLAQVASQMLKWMLNMSATHDERIARTAWLERKLYDEREGIVRQYRTKGYAEVEMEVDPDYRGEDHWWATTTPPTIPALPRLVPAARSPVTPAAPATATYSPRFIRPSSSKSEPSK